LKVGDKITLTALLPVYGSSAISKINGKIVFIKGLIPGEKAEVLIKEVKKDYYFARVTNIIESSPDRIDAPCKYYNICGGCHLQHINYDRQIRIKEEILIDSLKRISCIDVTLSDPLIYEKPFNYRHRGQFKIDNRNIGFYKEKTHDVVDISNCPIMTDAINNYFSLAKDTLLMEMKGNKISGINEFNITYGDKAIMLIKYKEGFITKGLIDRLLNKGFSGIFVTSNQNVSVYGDEYTIFELDGLKYSLSPMSFLQSHWKLNQIVVRFVKDSLMPLKGLKILDLYAGAGNFTLPLSAEADQIVGIEENPFAIKDGIRNLTLNGIKNYRFVLSSVESYDFKGSFDVFFIDPPRSGLTNRVISKLLSLKNLPKKIIYISCNPATLARDLKKLALKYEVESIRLIDFFPQTYHIESLTFLRLR
jgi:23S rRNA (uracil1939-C5)-methyltransferase